MNNFSALNTNFFLVTSFEVIHQIKIILIAPATQKSFKTTFFTMRDSKLNHLLMILIYNEELEEINIKLKINKLIKDKECRIPTFDMYQF